MPGATGVAALPARDAASAAPLDGAILPYGVPSPFESAVVRRPPGVPSPALTPLAQQLGVITPNGLTFVRNHGGTPRIDPKRHRLVVHGLVNRPLSFSMSDLLRFPSVERPHFLECAGNSAPGWQTLGAGVQFSHGLVSCCRWTGVLLRTVLDEAGVRGDARWLLAEGADDATFDRSFPLEKALDDALLVYGQNGEMLRPEQGYPLRLLLPGYEGSTSVKWLRRLKLLATPAYSREETARYTLPGANGTIRMFNFVMEVKSVITVPSPAQRLTAHGYFEGRGFAWSGRGRVKQVEVSSDGGASWSAARLDDHDAPKSFARFTFPIRWNGGEMILQSRAVDETGAIQPTFEQLVAARGRVLPYHVNAIASWHVARDGTVTDAPG